MTEKRRRGRPAFKPTAALRRTVEEMVSCGESKRAVALAVGIDEDTLTKHFAIELETGHAKKRREVIALLYRNARKGNASCIKKLEEMGRAVGAAKAIEGRGSGGAEGGSRAPELGKKEQRQEAAERVGGIFAVPAAPKLVVSNG